MMTSEQKARVSELRAAIAATETSAAGTPPDVRAAAVTLKREVRRGGTTARSLADALGVHATTLCRWEHDGVVASRRRPAPPKGQRSCASGFRMVQVVEPRPKSTRAPAEAVPPGRGLRVAHGPSGLVVDGLDVETLAALLRRMS